MGEMMPLKLRIVKAIPLGMLLGSLASYLWTIVLFGIGMTSKFDITKYWFVPVSVGLVVGGIVGCAFAIKRRSVIKSIIVLVIICTAVSCVASYYSDQSGLFDDVKGLLCFIARQTVFYSSAATAIVLAVYFGINKWVWRRSTPGAANGGKVVSLRQ